MRFDTCSYSYHDAGMPAVFPTQLLDAHDFI
jgi:hypothetical protein